MSREIERDELGPHAQDPALWKFIAARQAMLQAWSVLLTNASQDPRILLSETESTTTAMRDLLRLLT